MQNTQAENSALAQAVRRLALTAPQVAMTLIIDGRESLRTTSSRDLRTVLAELYGVELTNSLDLLDEIEIAGARLSGVIAAPFINRSGRNQVNVIVNGRWVQPRGLISRIEAGYRPVAARGRHPVAALVVETDPEPDRYQYSSSKLEVRLREERAIGEALARWCMPRLAAGRLRLVEALTWAQSPCNHFPSSPRHRRPMMTNH